MAPLITVTDGWKTNGEWNDTIWYGLLLSLVGFVITSAILIMCGCKGEKKKEEKQADAAADEKQDTGPPPILTSMLETSKQSTTKSSDSISTKAPGLPTVRTFGLKKRQPAIGGSQKSQRSIPGKSLSKVAGGSVRSQQSQKSEKSEKSTPSAKGKITSNKKA